MAVRDCQSPSPSGCQRAKILGTPVDHSVRGTLCNFSQKIDSSFPRKQTPYFLLTCGARHSGKGRIYAPRPLPKRGLDIDNRTNLVCIPPLRSYPSSEVQQYDLQMFQVTAREDVLWSSNIQSRILMQMSFQNFVDTVLTLMVLVETLGLTKSFRGPQGVIYIQPVRGYGCYYFCIQGRPARR
jgi:hypothetical protein